jgi:hypothetical protein
MLNLLVDTSSSVRSIQVNEDSIFVINSDNWNMPDAPVYLSKFSLDGRKLSIQLPRHYDRLYFYKELVVFQADVTTIELRRKNDLSIAYTINMKLNLAYFFENFFWGLVTDSLTFGIYNLDNGSAVIQPFSLKDVVAPLYDVVSLTSGKAVGYSIFDDNEELLEFELVGNKVKAQKRSKSKNRFNAKAFLVATL